MSIFWPREPRQPDNIVNANLKATSDDMRNGFVLVPYALDADRARKLAAWLLAFAKWREYWDGRKG